MRKIITVAGGIVIAIFGGMIGGIMVTSAWLGWELPRPGTVSMLIATAMSVVVGYELLSWFADWRGDEGAVYTTGWVVTVLAAMDAGGILAKRFYFALDVSWWEIASKLIYFVGWAGILAYLNIELQKIETKKSTNPGGI